MKTFTDEVAQRLDENRRNEPLNRTAHAFVEASTQPKYSYNFSWLGRPIIQYPQDIVAMQEIIWAVKPGAIVETGVAHGGSLIFHSSMLELIGAGGRVVGVDIDIRQHNRAAIEAHPMSRRITMIQGSSIAPEVLAQVKAAAEGKERVLVCLDSMHTHEHVLSELHAYAPMTTVGSYCVVFDTIIEDLPRDMYPDRPWWPGNSPKTAVREFLRTNPGFEIDKAIDHKLLISVARDGYLRRRG